MIPGFPNRRVAFGFAAAIGAFIALRFIDVFLLHPMFPGDYLLKIAPSSTRLILAVYASVTIGAYVARRRLMVPMISAVAFVWGFGLFYSYAHQGDYITTLRVVDLNWPEFIMIIVAAVLAVRTGEWIAKSARQKKTIET